MRPLSIVRFQWVYLAYLAVTLLKLALGWAAMVALLDLNPAAAQVGVDTLVHITAVMLAVSYAISLLLWWLAAWRRSVVAKWILAVFFAFNLLGTLWTLGLGKGEDATAMVLRLVAVVLNGYAMWLLFRPDAQAWFVPDAVADDAVDAPLS